MKYHQLNTLIALIITFSQLANCEFTCYTCNSSTEPNCISNPAGVTTATCSTNTCITKTEANGTITRACKVEADVCTEPGCFSCSTDKCNTNIICKSCSAAADCTQINPSITDNNQICSPAQTACVNILNNNQTVTRGCGVPSDCPDGSTADTCTSCATGNCNTAIFPASTLQCIQCSGTACNPAPSASLQACPLKEPQCYTFGDSAITMQRGCTTDSAAKCTAGTTDVNCVLCNSVGCNNLSYETTSKCIQCEDCAAVQQVTDGKECAAAVFTKAGCYTQTVKNKVTRGCLGSLTTACTKNEGCESCLADNCNVAAVSTAFTCLRCNSNNYPDCWNKPETIGPLPCANQTVNKCFEGKWADIVVRDCWEEASALMQFQCESSKVNCTICAESGCNKNVYPGAATRMEPGLALLAVILVVKQMV